MLGFAAPGERSFAPAALCDRSRTATAGASAREFASRTMEERNLDWQEEAEVMSDVHLGCAPYIGSHISYFTMATSTSHSAESVNLSKKTWEPEEICERREVEEDNFEWHGQASDLVTYDANGDLILQRRAKRPRQNQSKGSVDALIIHHHLTTRLHGVGLQIWRGALLLADFLLDKMNRSKSFDNVIAMELGAGTGFTGIIMARAARKVFITDRGTDILDNCARNVSANSGSYPYGDGSVQVRELDWEQPWPPMPSCTHREENEAKREREANPYGWSEEDLKQAESTSVLLAADVVYDQNLTCDFFGIVNQLMPPKSKKVLFLTLEKRYNFSLIDRDVVAHSYHHFRSFFHVENPVQDDCKDLGHEDKPIAQSSHSEDFQMTFKGKQLSVEQIQQHLVEYERGKDLELWKIWRC